MTGIPLPLPNFNPRNLPDDTGFTKSEKRALKNAWLIIIPKSIEHALEHSQRFFTEHEEILDRFRKRNGDLKLRVLHQHTFRMFEVYERIIFEGLEDYLRMSEIFNTFIAEAHMRKNVWVSDVKTMAKHFHEYLREVLEKVFSPTLKVAFDKLRTILEHCHQTGSYSYRESLTL